MKYVVFLLSALFTVITLVNLLTLGINLGRLSTFGYGYITGKILLLIMFSVIMFLSGRKIFRKHFSEQV